MIFGYIKSQTLELHYDKIVAESVDYLTAEFNFFTNEWEGFTKWCHFKKADQVFDVLLEDNKINKNAHLNLSAGEWEVYLHGNSDTGERITTNVVSIKVEPTGVLNGEPLPEIPLSVAEQVTALAQRAVEIAESVREDADNGVFDGEQGDDYILTEHDREEIAQKATNEIREELNNKADLVDGKIPLGQLPDDIGGGVESWNDLKDKPFYENSVSFVMPEDISSSVVIQSQPLEALGGLSLRFVKVGDAFATPEETYGGAIDATIQGQNSSYIVDESFVNNIEIGFALIFANNAFVPLCINATSVGTAILPTADIFGADAVFDVSESGFYMLSVDGMGQVNSFNKTTIKKLDSKFINIEEVAEKAVEMIDSSLLSAIGSGVLE